MTSVLTGPQVSPSEWYQYPPLPGESVRVLEGCSVAYLIVLLELSAISMYFNKTVIR